ncbi:MAG: hypothetical protein JXR76_32520 [Deltaproteobacteria bacterium]|nr:hypothetical protein [Deltaproteobacteria bacterium]
MISDPEARIAQFYAWVHKYVAKAMNCSRGRWENLWSSEKSSVIPLESAEDIQSKIVYCLINPVNAHLTAKASQWQGVWLYKQSHSQTVKRPDKYFQRDGTMPQTVELQIHVPESHENMRVAAYEKLIEEQLSAQEDEIAEAMKKKTTDIHGNGSGFNAIIHSQTTIHRRTARHESEIFLPGKKAANQCNTSLQIFRLTVLGCVEAVERREKGCHVSGGHLCNANSFGRIGVVSINEVWLKRSWVYKKEIDGNARVFCTPASSVGN